MENDTAIFWNILWYGVLPVVGTIIAWSLVGYPKWHVWSAHQSGLADLQRAKNEQQIQIAQAQSRLDAAQLNKQAAVIEAEAVALQIKAIGEQLTRHDLYLKWQWIKMMEDHSDDSIIYVPTEANIPILEAGRYMERNGVRANVSEGSG